MRPLFFLTCFFICMASAAQNFETDKANQEHVRQLGFLVGNWKGKGWMMMQDGKKHFFDQTEKVQFKLDETALLIEGNGTAEGRNIHNAMAIVNWNKAANVYSFRSWLASGLGGEFKGEIKEGKFYWYPNANMQYIIWLNEKGQWFEIGEMKRNNEWFRFFEMTLDKE